MSMHARTIPEVRWHQLFFFEYLTSVSATQVTWRCGQDVQGPCYHWSLCCH